MKGTTESGFTYDISDDVADDMELFEALCAVDNGDIKRLPDIVAKMLGDGKERLYEHCRGDNGRVSMRRVLTEIGEIFSIQEDKVKN